MTETRFTIRDYERLPEGFPCQLIEGDFVKQPSPRFGHQRIVSRLVHMIAEKYGPDCVVPAPIDIALDDFNVVQPDVAVWATPPARDVRWAPIPTLVIEVLSPSTAAGDRTQKTRLYVTAGVVEVWLVEPDTGAIEIHTPGGSKRYEAHELATSDALVEFSVCGRDLCS